MSRRTEDLAQYDNLPGTGYQPGKADGADEVEEIVVREPGDLPGQGLHAGAHEEPGEDGSERIDGEHGPVETIVVHTRTFYGSLFHVIS